MSLLLKKLQYLTTLFKNVSAKDAYIINKNINDTEHLLKLPTSNVRRVMAEQKVQMESLLAEKCIPLTRFYLADEKKQLQYFLHSERLAAFFMDLPMAEATIFKHQLTQAQATLPLLDIESQASLTFDELNQQEQALALDVGHSDVDNIVEFKIGYEQQTYLQKLKNLAGIIDSPVEREYESSFYEIELNEKDEKNLLVYADYHDGCMLYCELSPLMQIKAQQAFKANSKADELRA
ncbi:hypothetical protein N8878_07925 [Psychromonas sp.]|nr:hypothetical protein [Psychromonas sp.]